MKLIFTRGTFREKLFSSMLFTTLTTLMLCSSLLLIVFSSRMEDSARQEAAFIIPAISSGISSLSIGTTTPVPQVIERYAQHHCGEFLPITAIFSPLSPKEQSAVPRAFTLLRRFL